MSAASADPKDEGLFRCTLVHAWRVLYHCATPPVPGPSSWIDVKPRPAPRAETVFQVSAPYLVPSHSASLRPRLPTSLHCHLIAWLWAASLGHLLCFWCRLHLSSTTLQPGPSAVTHPLLPCYPVSCSSHQSGPEGLMAQALPAPSCL